MNDIPKSWEFNKAFTDAFVMWSIWECKHPCHFAAWCAACL